MATTDPVLRRRKPPLALLADRDEDTRQMYADSLLLGSWSVDQAADGREALAKAISSRPDVIVTDTMLPGINGFTLCRLLRRDLATSAIPVVFVTADAQGIEAELAEAAGADLVLTKPCLPERLRQELHQLLVARDRFAAADGVLNRATDTARRTQTLKEAHKRGDTTRPPLSPPVIVCPFCDRPLIYRRSHVGGVSRKHAEQWDYFDCESGCGTFQYRARTRRIRKVV